MRPVSVRRILTGIAVVLACGMPAWGDEQDAAFDLKYKDRDAIALLDEFRIIVNPDWSYTKRWHKRYKILNENAQDLGELTLSYSKSRERVTVRAAFTVTPDGKRLRCTRIQDLNVYSNTPQYSDTMVKAITMPEIKAGSILEYEIETRSSGVPTGHAFWDTIDFNFSRPTKRGEYCVILPRCLNVAYKAFNLAYEPEITETARETVYRWRFRNAGPPGSGDKPVAAPAEGLVNTAVFSSLRDWGELSRGYYALAQKSLKISGEIRAAARRICGGAVTTRDKVRALLEYIRKNFRYVSMNFGDNALVPHPTDDTMRNKYGDCKDTSLLCVAMLKAAGVDACLALVNVGQASFDPRSLPPMYMFNHAIMKVEDKDNGSFFVDPLLYGYDVDEFPFSHQGIYALLIDGGDGKFERLPVHGEDKNTLTYFREIKINADGSAFAEVKQVLDPITSNEIRDSMNKNGQSGVWPYVMSMCGGVRGPVEVIEWGSAGLDQKYGLITLQAKFIGKEAFPLDGKLMVVDVIPFLNIDSFSGMGDQVLLSWPVNVRCDVVTRYTIPREFSAVHVPENRDLRMGFFSLQRRYTSAGGTITVHDTVRCMQMRSRQEELAKLKEFLGNLSGRMLQRIILQKRSR